MLVPELTRGLDGPQDRRNVIVRGEVVAIDHSAILKVIAGEADGTSAGRLHKSWRDGERVHWWSSKPRRYFRRNQLAVDEAQVQY